MTERVTGLTCSDSPIKVDWVFVQRAKQFNGQLCIRCVQADGCLVDFVACPEVDPGMWVGLRHDPHRDDTTDGWITETHRVRSTIKRCDPDVELVEMDESLFGGDDDVEM